MQIRRWILRLSFLGLLVASTGISPAFCGEAVPLKVLTLNTWLLRVFGHPIGKDIGVRRRIIPAAVAETGADLIAFQEVWSNRHKRYLVDELKKLGYPYSVYNRRAVGMGNGLVLVSRYPILSSSVAPIFSRHTRLDEKVANKRAFYAEIKVSETRTIDFFTVHMGALTYDSKLGNYDREQKARQREQYMEFKHWIKTTRKHPMTVIAGDFNADYRTLSGGRFHPNYADDYLEFIDRGCGSNEDFLNTFLTANTMDATSPAKPTYSRENPYVLQGYFANAPSETEDYIYTCGIDRTRILKSAVIFDGPVSENALRLKSIDPRSEPLRLSDHYGLMTEIAVE